MDILERAQDRLNLGNLSVLGLTILEDLIREVKHLRENTHKTVRVRIAVAANESGEWCAAGNDEGADEYVIEQANWDDNPDALISWIEADVPVPNPKPKESRVTIEGEVTNG